MAIEFAKIRDHHTLISREFRMLESIARRSVVLSSRRSATKTRELRNLRRAGRSSSTMSARTPTRTVSVSHPTLGGLTGARVERVVDTLDAMLKAGPRHLTVRQWQAAQIFRSALLGGDVARAAIMPSICSSRRIAIRRRVSGSLPKHRLRRQCRQQDFSRSSPSSHA
jgi:hypothetical protein